MQHAIFQSFPAPASLTTFQPGTFSFMYTAPGPNTQCVIASLEKMADAMEFCVEWAEYAQQSP